MLIDNPSEPASRVCPSDRARATVWKPGLPAAPGRFWTTMAWPSSFDIERARMRATASWLPPAATGTTRRMEREGRQTGESTPPSPADAGSGIAARNPRRWRRRIRRSSCCAGRRFVTSNRARQCIQLNAAITKSQPRGGPSPRNLARGLPPRIRADGTPHGPLRSPRSTPIERSFQIERRWDRFAQVRMGPGPDWKS